MYYESLNVFYMHNYNKFILCSDWLSWGFSFMSNHLFVSEAEMMLTAIYLRDSVDEETPVVKEILMVGLGHQKSRPHLMARVDETLLIYEVFPYTAPPSSSTPSASEDDHLNIRFRKIRHGLLIKQRHARGAKIRPEPAHAAWLRPFDDVSGYSGVCTQSYSMLLSCKP